jgi:hypothetical protein
MAKEIDSFLGEFWSVQKNEMDKNPCFGEVAREVMMQVSGN